MRLNIRQMMYSPLVDEVDSGRRSTLLVGQAVDDGEAVGEVLREIAALEVGDIASFYLLHGSRNSLKGLDAS